MRKLRGFIILPLLGFILISISIYGVYFLWNTGVKDSPKIEINTPKLPAFITNKDITPTPFEFSDLTIPGLRNREYESKLSIVQKIAQNNEYSSNLASYTSDGLKIYGLLTIPNSSKPAEGFPAIVFVHGYIPPKQYRTKVDYLSYVDQLAKNGFVVFKIDLRGHDQSEGEPGGAYYSGDYVIDALNAYSALQNYDAVNKNAVGFWGHSMAGNIVFRSMVIKKNVPAAVIWAGAGYTYTDLQEYAIDDNSYQPPQADSEVARKRQKLRDLYGSFELDHWFWKQVPGTNYLNDVNGAIQLNHAVDDKVVSVDYSRNLVRYLENSQITFEIKEYPSGGHNLTGSTISQAMENSIDFFKKYLK